MTKTTPLMIALFGAALTVGCAGAQKQATATKVASAEGKKPCSKDCNKDCGDKAELAMLPAADLIAQRKAGEAMVIYDVNSKERFLKGHVPGAIHVNRRALTHLELPKDKGAKTVFYCGSPRCKASHKAARVAIGMGYTNVFVMPEGIKGWEAAGHATEAGGQAQKFGVISAKDLQGKLQGAAQVHVVDVNSPERFAKGHVPGAIHAKASELAAAKLPTNKGAMLVFYCGSKRCAASHKAANAAADMGYTNVWVMSDGIKGWESGGLATEK